jgi:peptidoglycan/LPS O-acetylase OafA/YrhL
MSADSTARTTVMGYRPGLDGLRAIAIGLVFLHHTGAIVVPSWRGRFFKGGFLGVDLFFALSGFLITTLLLERRGTDSQLRSFYARRALRLLPAVVVLLLAMLLITILEGSDLARALRTFPVVLGYVTNWAALHNIVISPYVTHLWSLAIEEQFYLVWPVTLLALLALRLSREEVAVVALVLAAASALWRAHLWEIGTGWLAIYIRTDARADALLIGAMLALIGPFRVTKYFNAAARNTAAYCGLAILIGGSWFVPPSSKMLYLGGFTVVAIGAVAIIAVETTGPWSGHRVLSSAPMVFVGRLSYSLYLWHFLVFWVVAVHLASWPTGVRFAVSWTAAFACAYASFAIVERPALRLKERIGNVQPPQPVAEVRAHE